MEGGSRDQRMFVEIAEGRTKVWKVDGLQRLKVAVDSYLREIIPVALSSRR